MKNFDQIIWREQLTFVDFYASWCGPCKQMEPIVEQFKDRMHHRTDVYRIDIEDPEMLPVVRRYNIVSIPTLMFFRRGEVLWRESGCVGYNHLVTILEELEQYELAEMRY